jgi:formylglycine-generating enzyme required for sulfatase activity
MRTIANLTIILFAFCCISAARGVTFDWAIVGNSGNADDIHGYGGVNYTYCISKQEVTNTQYVEFLNAVAASDPNGTYSIKMGSDTQGGIIRSGVDGHYTYSIKPNAVGHGHDGGDYSYTNKPVTFVSFFNAMRFVNWLENGQPTGGQDSSTTEDGTYTIEDGIRENRKSGAIYFIPNEDEWYKAAYHKNDGVTGNYWDYPASTNMMPDNNLPSSDTGNSANYRDGEGYTTGDRAYPMTDVGAYTLSESPYGTFDQGGNLFEWNESVWEQRFRGARGGCWYNNAYQNLRAAERKKSSPNGEYFTNGIRIVMIPEPNTMLLGALLAMGILFRRCL